MKKSGNLTTNSISKLIAFMRMFRLVACFFYHCLGLIFSYDFFEEVNNLL